MSKKTKTKTHKEIQIFLNLCKQHFPRLAWEMANIQEFPEFWQAKQAFGVNAIAFAGVGEFWAIAIMLVATPKGKRLAHAEFFPYLMSRKFCFRLMEKILFP